MAIKQRLKKIFGINYRHYISFIITLGVVALGIFCFPNAIPRLIEACTDFGLSCAFYFCEVFSDSNPIMPTVNEIQSWQWVPSKYQPLTVLPFTWEEFKVAWGQYWKTFANWETVKAYFVGVGLVLSYVAQGLLIIMPFVLLLYMVFSRSMKTQNNDYDKETWFLRLCKRIAKYTYRPVVKWIKGYIEFLKEKRFWWKLWVFLFAFYFNFFTIFIEFIAFYLYFITAFDFVNIYRQVYKLMLDLTPMIRFIPVVLWVVIGVFLLSYFARKRAYKELDHRERRNVGFLGERGVMTIVYGVMGAGKTKLMTDMALSDEVRFRDMAFEIIIESDFKFPHMHWAVPDGP